MTQPEGGARSTLFVEVEPDTKNFDRELNTDVNKSAKKLEASIKKTTQNITESFDEAGRKIERIFTTIEQDGKVKTKVLERAFDAAGKKIERSFEAVSRQVLDTGEVVDLVAKIAADSAADSFEKAGERIEDAFREAARVAEVEALKIKLASEEASKGIAENGSFLQRLFNKLGESVATLGTALIGLSSNVSPAGLITLGVTITGIVALAPGVVALGGALLSLVGILNLLPAAGAVAVGAIIPLVLAFQNFGDAITAIADGDPKKIAEALEKLSPAARSVAKEFRKALPVLHDFQKTIQNAFFTPLKGNLTLLVKNLLPTLQGGFANIAQAAGRAASNFADFLGSDKTIGIIDDILTTVSASIDKIAPGIQQVVSAFFDLADAGLPTVLKLADGFGTLLTKFANFLEESVKSGSFQTFLDTALKTLGELVDLGKAVGGLIAAIFGGDAVSAGQDFLVTLTDIVTQLTLFFKSAEGQQSIKDMLETIKFLVILLKSAAGVVELFFKAFTWGKQAVIWVKQTAKDIGGFFTDLWHDIEDIWNNITDFFGMIGAWFGALPGKIGAFLSSIPGRIEAFFKMLGDAALRSVGHVIGIILFAFQVLPGKIVDAVKALPGLLGDFFSHVWSMVQDKAAAGFEAVVNFAKGLPSKLINALGNLGAIVGNFFSSAIDRAKKNVTDGFNRIVAFVGSIPKKIRDAFNAAGSFVTNIGGDIADAIKRFLNKAIDKINSGIADVDNYLPGDLGRIPRLAKGGVISPRAGGTMAVLAEAGEREIASPESLMRKIVHDESGSGIVFESGAIVVQFAGVVPTEAEALRTGQAVAEGITSTLERQKARTRVRTMSR